MVWAGLRVAGISTVVSFAAGLWLAWLLVNRQFRGRREVGALATAALALPAPALCYYLLIEPAWSWGLTGAAVLSATPMLVRAGRMAFASLDPVYGKAARSLGAGEWRVFWRAEFPLVWRPALAAAGLAFGRVLAELGAGVLIAARLSR